MKRNIKYLCSVALVALAFACSGPQPRTVEMPAFEATNASNFDVRAVKLTDSNTVLSCYVEFRPGWWITIDSAATITAKGENYSLIGADGIKPGERYVMPKDGKTEFKLIFPAIPLDTKTIDFREGDGWAVWGIDISGESRADAVYPEGLPKDVRDACEGEVTIEPVNKAEMTRLNFHILGYRPEFGKIELYIRNLGATESMGGIALDA